MGCPCRPFFVDFMVWMMELSFRTAKWSPILVLRVRGATVNVRWPTHWWLYLERKKWSGVKLLQVIYSVHTYFSFM